jgi:phospholipid transport system substrate-binding protein
LNTAVHADPAAQAVIIQASNELLAQLDSEHIETGNAAALETLVDETLTRHVDFDAFSRFVLGKHWRQATDQQRSRFTEGFRQLVVRTYSAALQQARITRVRFPAPRDSGKDGRAVVPTIVELAGNPPIAVSYRMYLKHEQWKIYDILIENVSITVNYRSEFSRIIAAHGLSGLIEQLEERNGQTAGEAV